MKILFSFVFAVFALAGRCQQIEQYYDWQWKRTDPSSARFIAIMKQLDSVWERKDYYLQERSLQMSGYYTDTSCKVQHGRFNYFHANGNQESTGEYVKGKKEGLWLKYHDNGMMSDSTVYMNGKATGTSLSWHESGFLADSSVWKEDGSGISISWFDDGVPSAAGYYGPGYKKTGKWQFFHHNGKLSALETYLNDKVINKTYYDEAGNLIADTTNHDREASFAGGAAGWQKFILKGLYFPS